MSLQTPEAIRDLRRKLYIKAKEEPGYRFYSLYDKVCRPDILAHAYGLAKANKGAPGVDGKDFVQIESEGLEKWLKGLEEELRTRSYRPQAVKRVWIPKLNGERRPLGIPTIRDRVVQTAAVLVLEPIFEADFPEEMYGYRPRRSALDAVKQVHQGLKEGYRDVVDADLSQYFDTIPHAELMRSVARRVSDGAMLKLIKMWLKAPVQEQNERGKWIIKGGKKQKQGTPQGGVASPLLSNIYMNRYLKAWRAWKVGEKLKARVINYADDFVILCRGTAKEALEATQEIMTKIGLKVSEEKTRIVKAGKESFDFLGYTFGQLVYRPAGRRYFGVSPSRKAEARYRQRIRQILHSGNKEPWEKISAQVNRVTEGWAGYFHYGSVTRTYWKLDAFLLARARRFLRKRRKIPGRGYRQLRSETIFNEEALVSLASLRVAPLNALM